ncbi:MAG TPA: alpha/beta hydrolase [Caldilineaceae bacterium]|nr:alpha/beta hydrolase [Caldilineaceae bacterium]
MFPHRLARVGLSALAALVVLLTAAASAFTQSGDQIFLPMIKQTDQSVQAAGGATERKPAQTRPTIVLVHGAWADGTGWQEVIKRLERDDYDVIAVQNPLTSLADDVATTKRVIDAESAKGPVIVVGHSYGGAVITGAAAGNPNVKALVYIAAFAPAVGEPLGLLLQQYPTELGQILVFDSAGFAYLDRSRFSEVFAADVDPNTARVMAAAQKPAFGGIFSEHLDAAAWETIPSWYMVAANDKALSPEMERFLANRMHATTVEVQTSHVPFISKPNEVVKLIETATQATVP